MISVSHLTKWYGDHLAVDDLSFEIGEGHVYGFLGPNGAGKSTTMNIITGCLSASAGQILINGYDIFEQPDKAKRQIGYLPEQPPLYMNESPLEYLTFVGEAKGLRGSQLQEQVDSVIQQTGIEDVCCRRISNLSKGYKQRVGIAQALLGNPKVIILDEPTVGLDPLQIIEIRDLIRKLGQEHTVIFSSHILSEVQTICDRILMIAHGKLVAFDTPDNLGKQMMSVGEINLMTECSEAEARQILDKVEWVVELTIQEKAADRCLVNIKTDYEDIYKVSRLIFKAFADNRTILLEMSLKKANLEDVFIELTESAAPQVETKDEEDKE